MDGPRCSGSHSPHPNAAPATAGLGEQHRGSAPRSSPEVPRVPGATGKYQWVLRSCRKAGWFQRVGVLRRYINMVLKPQLLRARPERRGSPAGGGIGGEIQRELKLKQKTFRARCLPKTARHRKAAPPYFPSHPFIGCS